MYKKSDRSSAEPSVLVTTRVDPKTRALLEELAWKSRTSISHETKAAILRGLQHLQQEADR